MIRSALASFFMTVTAGAGPTHAEHSLAIRLAPQTVDGRVDAIVVTEAFDVAPMPAGELLLSLPIITESVPGVLRDPATLLARDDAGPLPLDRSDDPVDPTQMKQDHRWYTRRATSGPVTVSYVARPRVITADTRPAALVDMRTEGDGVYGSTKILLAVPASGWPRQVRIEWDLAAMAPGSKAVSSFGEGTTDATLDAETLGLGYFMAGPFHKLPATANDGFMLYYLSQPDFDLAAAARDVVATYEYASQFFGTEAQPFRALMRTTERFQGGGGGGRNSFIFGTVKGAPLPLDDVKALLTHEALHNWIGSLQKGPPGLWFVEGATEYYAAILPFRLGHRTVEQMAAHIDSWTAGYYANARRTMGEDAAAAAFWSDAEAQLLPYNRGPLYIALVDARLRAASNGQQRVDTLVRSMVQALRTGNASEELWLSLVTDALGERAQRDFADLKSGRMLDLPDDLFGPCFHRVAGPVRRYLPGFKFEVAADGRRIVGPVRAGSAAAAAGLVRGDEVLNWRVMDDGVRQYAAPMTLKVKSAAMTHDVTIDPWGAASDGYRWIVVLPRPADCHL